MNKFRGSGVGFVKAQFKLLAGLIAGLVMGIAGVAVASIPDSSGVIHGCYSSGLLGTGSLRVINSPTQNCTGGETAVGWNTSSTGQYVSDLTEVDFSGMDLRYRNFSNTNLSNSTLTGIRATRGDFHGANFTGSSVGLYGDHMNLAGANFTDATLDSSGYIAYSDMSDTDMDGTTLTAGQIQYSDLSNVDFRNATFQSDLSLTMDTLTGANFSGTTLNGITLHSSPSGATFTNVHFVNADLWGADYSGINLSGVTWSNTRCPDGTNSNDHSNTCTGHLAP